MIFSELACEGAASALHGFGTVSSVFQPRSDWNICNKQFDNEFLMRRLVLTAVLAIPLVGCVNAKPPSDTGDPVVSSPTSPSGSTTQPAGGTSGTATPLAYNPDMKLLFASDCVACHSSNRPSGGYSMSTYGQVMAAVRPGSSSSLLVSVTQSGGSMYRYFSGTNTTRQSKATSVRTWVVTYNAQENRP